MADAARLLGTRWCWPWLVALALVLATAPTVALACKCYEGEPPPPALRRPVWPESSGLVLSSESIEIDCSTPHQCHWRSTHVYTRSGPGEAARVRLGLPFEQFMSPSVSLGGQTFAPAPEDPEARAAARLRHPDDGYPQPEPESLYFWLEDDGQQTTVELTIEGEVVRYGRGEAEGWYAGECCSFNALEVRHPFVPTYDETNEWVWADTNPDAVPPGAHTRMRVRGARRLTFEFDGPIATAPDDDVQVDAPSRAEFRFKATDPGRLKGGPFIGVGGAVLDLKGPRGRIGWEHTHPYPFLFYSAALETDFRNEFTLAPAIEISHGRDSLWWMVPCAGLGFGVPIQVLPEVRPAIRVQASLSWRMVSFVTTFDWLMALRTTSAGVERPSMLRLAMFGQLSF